MNRRGFFQRMLGLALAPAAAALAPIAAALADPLGCRELIAWRFKTSAVVLNDGWLVLLARDAYTPAPGETFNLTIGR